MRDLEALARSVLRSELNTDLPDLPEDESEPHGLGLRHAFRHLAAEVKRLRLALAPFASLGKSIPENWPDDCRLRIDTLHNDLECIAYHGIPESILGLLPTLAEWRKAAQAAERKG